MTKRKFSPPSYDKMPYEIRSLPSRSFLNAAIITYIQKDQHSLLARETEIYFFDQVSLGLEYDFDVPACGLGGISKSLKLGII